MNKTWKVLAVAALVVAVVVVVLQKRAGRPSTPPEPSPPPRTSQPALPVASTARVPSASSPGSQSATALVPASEPAGEAAALPRLVDLGAGQCIPCKAMAPILEELRLQYAGRLRVEFYDVWQDPDIGKSFGIRLIPTQIFFDAEGNERFRHEGFMSRQDILNKWAELGVNLEHPTK
ncbi:MAG: thioredoxin family protein [Phycisphaerae bacterium]|nr:thioredoxin family protein [Phycisphaerae bacterium]